MKDDEKLKKVNMIKSKKIRWVSKRKLVLAFFNYLDGIEKDYKELVKYIKYQKGDVEANISLKEEGTSWRLILTVDGKQHADIRCSLGMVFTSIDFLRRIYKIKELE